MRSSPRRSSRRSRCSRRGRWRSSCSAPRSRRRPVTRSAGSPAARDTPILALVEPEDADAARHACEAGASDFVARPVDGALLRERARLLLARAQERRALREAQERLESAQRLARSGSFAVSLASGEVDASAPLFELLGLLPRAGQPYRAFADLIAAEDHEPLRRAVLSCLEDDRSASLDVRAHRSDGVQRVLRCRLVARRDLDGEATALEGSVQDVTESRRSEERMRSLVYTDELTQLGNRRSIGQKLGGMLRESGARVGVLVLELDHFERVNDTLGPAAGDALLREAAGRLLDAIELGEGIECRRDQVAVARRSGGEFALLVPRVADPRALADLARRGLAALAQPFVLDAHEVTLGASAGIAVSPDDGGDGETLVRNAATALHHAKAQGRGGLQFYRASMNASAFSRMILEAKLRRALEQGEFVLHYQPQISLQTDEVVGFEGVVRWQEPELGLVGARRVHPAGRGDRPDPAARRLDRARGVPPGRGLARARRLPGADLDQPLAAAVPRARAGRADRGGARRDGRARRPGSASRSPRTCCCTTRSSRSRRSRACASSACASRSTTSARATPRSRTCATCPPTRSRSTAHFSQGFASEDAAAALTASIVAMGVALGLRVVAEGVEEEQQRLLLKAWGCHEAQGFLFGRAVPAHEAERTWAARVRDESEGPASGRL